MDFSLIISALVLITVILVYLQIRRQRTESEGSQSNQANEEQLRELEKENGKLQGRIEKSVETFKAQEQTLKELYEEKDSLLKKYMVEQTRNKELSSRISEQKEDLKKLKDSMQLEFENIANKIFKKSTESLSSTNAEKIGDLLAPLKEKMVAFEKQVEDKYSKQLKDTESLKTELKNLLNLNQQLSEDASNLTRALKGDSKKQGNWGEFILERVLEMSGLRKNEEYFTQVNDTNVEGQRIQPDIVVQLPDDKHLIIDSKVSLLDYDRYVSSEDEQQRSLALKAHVNSVKNHIKGLSEKNYQTSKQLKSPDFVFMFMPIESSFSVSISAEPELFNYAWERKIVMVSPSTLLASLRTIANIWKIERQNKNAEKIAVESGRLYDKFVGFLTDMQKIGNRLDQTKKSYDEAMGKLQTGSGNLIRKAEILQELGAKSTKSIPQELIDEDSQNLIES